MVVGIHHAHAFWPGMFFLFGLSRLLFFVLLGLLIAMLVRMLTRRGGSRPAPWGPPHMPGTPPPPPTNSAQQPSALEILRQRYARGEINNETFEHMRERLEASERPEQ